MSSRDHFAQAYLVTVVVGIIYTGYLAWITHPSKKHWSAGKTIRFVLTGLMFYVAGICLAWQLAVTETPQLRFDATELNNADDPNALLVKRVNQFNREINVQWGKSQYINTMTLFFIFGGVLAAGKVLTHRYCRDTSEDSQSEFT